MSYEIKKINKHNYNHDNNKQLLQKSKFCYDISSDLQYAAFKTIKNENTIYLISVDGFETVNAFVIVDLKCNSIKSKIPINVSKCAEISLLCSNKKTRVKGIMTILLNKVISDFIPDAKPSCRYILLVPAKQNRSKLEEFYKNFGFEIVKNEERYSVMQLDIFNRPQMRPFILSPVTSAQSPNKSPVYSHRSTARSRSRDRVTEKSRSRSRSRDRVIEKSRFTFRR